MRIDLGRVTTAPFAHLYVHVPFCRHKCGYCDFNAYAGMDRLMPDYVDALLIELDRARRHFPFDRLRTVYLGGGTPSLLGPAEVTRLLGGIQAMLPLEAGAEVTLEANPASTDGERLGAWREGGVTRLSIGVQGFDRRALGVLERRTDGAMAEGAIGLARTAGFDNLSIDLIYGVPGQTPDSWADTVTRAVELAPDHVSAYCLTFEAGTLLTRRLEDGKLQAVSSDDQWVQLDIAESVLGAAGYRRYEVSNWSRAGRESRHNRAYWECRPVYGAGAGAHSYATSGAGAWRWWNVARPRDYMAAARAGLPVADGELLEARRATAERRMLGLRTADGIPDFNAPALDPLLEAGLLERSGGRLRPTRKGLDMNNEVALAVI